jgi:tetratricopeptide (TPR) repeat protein
MGMVLARMGGLKRAAEQYREAIRLEPAYAEARNNLGNLLEALGDVQGAIAQYREALRIRPKYAMARANLERLRAPVASR